MSFRCFIEPVEFIGDHTLLPLPFLLVQSLRILCKPQNLQRAGVIRPFLRKGDSRFCTGIHSSRRQSSFSSSILWKKLQRWHPFSVLMEPIKEPIVCDSSLRFSERTFIRMMTTIIKIVFANGLPTTGKIRSLESSFNNGGLDSRREA